MMRKFLYAAFAGLLLVAGAVTAVQATGTSPAVQPAHAWMAGGGPGWGRHLDPRRVDAMLAYLKTDLAITDQQQTQWDAFAAAVRDSADHIRQLHAQAAPKEDGKHERPNAVERLQRMEQFTEARLQAIKTVRPPFEALYAAMSDDQKQRTDELLSQHRGHWRH